jgi:hypothetical protein
MKGNNSPVECSAVVADSRLPTPDWVALTGIGITIGVHLILAATLSGPNFAFIAAACLFWIGFVIVRACQDRNNIRTWGFRVENLGRATALSAVLFVVIAGLMGVYAWGNGTLSFPPHTLLLFLLYPIWGVLQQFLALGIVVTNLERLPVLRGHPAILVVLSAVLFGLVHVYDARLVAGTFFLELWLVPLFLKYRNLWPLGVLHGWLGGLFYLWVLNRDLWRETF